MQVHFGLDSLCAEWSGAVVCIGTFDGVHLGHRSVILEAVEAARKAELPSCLVTFDRHPAATLNPSRVPLAIASLEQNLAQFQKLGISLTLVLPFERELSEMTAETFIAQILRGSLKGSSLVIGHDFALGKDRQGSAEWLSKRLPTTVMPPFLVEGQRVSSSGIRDAVAAGRMEDAARFLGRPFAMTGLVVCGRRLGRQLGFPTANLARSVASVMPRDGVYRGLMETPVGTYQAAISVGIRPAVDSGARTVEAYLLDYPGDQIYGAPCRLEFHECLREERNFPSLDALTEQIERDVNEVRLRSS